MTLAKVMQQRKGGVGEGTREGDGMEGQSTEGLQLLLCVRLKVCTVIEANCLSVSILAYYSRRGGKSINFSVDFAADRGGESERDDDVVREVGECVW